MFLRYLWAYLAIMDGRSNSSFLAAVAGKRANYSMLTHAVT
jgi:hypothetical protein